MKLRVLIFLLVFLGIICAVNFAHGGIKDLSKPEARQHEPLSAGDLSITSPLPSPAVPFAMVARPQSVTPGSGGPPPVNLLTAGVYQNGNHPNNSGVADVAFGDFNGDGKQDILTVDGSACISVLPGDGKGHFSGTPIDSCVFPTGSINQVVVGDFNKDGIPDVAVLSQTCCNPNYINIMLAQGNGDGTFTYKNTITFYWVNNQGQLGYNEIATSLNAADLNRDGNLDLVMTTTGGNANSDAIYVFLGNGTFGFTQSQSQIPGLGTCSLINGAVIADFNGDGIPDLAVTNTDCGLHEVEILLGKGDGTFQTLPNFQFPTDVGGPSKIAVGDFRGNGMIDLVVITGVGGSPITTFLGNGDGTFGSPNDSPSVYDQGNLAVGDFNGDGKDDVIVSSNSSGYFAGDLDGVQLSNGDGTFAAPVQYSVLASPTSVFVADLNGDGHPDWVSLSHSSEYFCVGLNSGNGGFVAAVDRFTTPGDAGATSAIAAADFNKDGNLDYATVGYDHLYPSLDISLGDGSGKFAPPVQYTAGANPSALTIGDFNRDGYPDVAVLDQSDGEVSVLLNKADGTGTLGSAVSYVVGAGGGLILTADFNGDGIPDLIVTNSGDGTVSVLLGNGDGTFGEQRSFTAQTGGYYLAVADFNGDGKLDAAVTSYNGGTISVLLGNGDGTFQPPASFSNGLQIACGIATGDFRNIGKADLAVCGQLINNGSNGYGGVAILLGNGDGTFQSPVDYPTVPPGLNGNPLTFGTPRVADLNKDGNMDIAIPNMYAYADGVNLGPAILLGNGDGTFTLNPAQPAIAGTFQQDIAIGDFNNDGVMDMVVQNFDPAYSTDNGASTVTMLLSAAGTSVVLQSSQNPSTQGLSVTFTASVVTSLIGLPTPTGTVTFEWGSTKVPVPLVDGVATYEVSALPLGTTIVFAAYSGDANFLPETSLGLPQLETAAPLVITTNALPDAVQNVAYNQTVVATGGIQPYSFSITSGALPTGLTLHSGTGAISGTPTILGPASFTVQVQDSESPAMTATANLQITVVADTPASITATSGTPQSATVNTAFPAPLVVTVKDGSGNPVSGVAVTFTAPTSGASGAFAGGVNTAVTNASGLATSAVFTANSTAGPYTVTASVTGVPGTASFSLTNTASVAANITATSGTPQSTTVNTAFPGPLGVTVKDGSGNPVSGVTVTFTTPGTGASGTFAGGVNTAVTNASGVATSAVFTANSTAGAYTVTASATGVSGTASFSLTNVAGTPASIAAMSGTPQSTTVGTAFAAPLVVTVKDGSGNPVSGVTVTFTAPTTGASGTFTGGANTAVTNASGVATSSAFTANSTAGAYTVTAAVTGVPGMASFSLTNVAGTPASVTATSGTPQSATVGTAFAAPLGVTVKDGSGNPVSGVTVTFTAPTTGASGTFAGGVNTAVTNASGMATSGVFTANVTTGGYSVIASVLGVSVTAAFSLTNVSSSSLVITTAGLPNGVAGSPYSATIVAAGGTGSYTFSVKSGFLPAGLSLSSSGVLSGTTSTSAIVNFTVQVQDSGTPPQTATASFQFTIVGALTMSTPGLPEGMAGGSYSTSLSAAGGASPYTFTLIAGKLPAGLSLNGGTISGKPSVAGTSNFTAQVTDSSSPPQKATEQLSITIVAALEITTTSLPNASDGAGYSATINVKGGFPFYSFAIVGGSLPPGISLSPFDGNVGVVESLPGVLGGAQGSGTYTFDFQATDAGGNTATAQLSITVGGGLAVTTTSLPNGTLGIPYSASLAASGGKPPYKFSIYFGALPAGLSLNSNGTISGTPSVASLAFFAVQVKDSSSPPLQSGSGSLIIVINPPGPLGITTTILPTGGVGSPYNGSISAAGGVGPYTFNVTGGALPPGLSVSKKGVITGKPTAAGIWNFTVQVLDSESPVQTASAPLSITITQKPLPLVIATTSLPDTYVGGSYNQSITAAGGDGIYTFTTVGGSVPSGLSLSGSGIVSGTPSTAETSSFTIQVQDTSNPPQTAKSKLSIKVAPKPGPLTIDTKSLPGGIVGNSYNSNVAASGGATPYTFTVAAGSMPSGFALESATGQISGTLSPVGTFTFTIQVQDSESPAQTASESYSITVNPTKLTLVAGATPVGAVGDQYNASLIASGGTPPYNYSVSSGSLPPGLVPINLGSEAIFGIPSTAGTFNSTMQVQDSGTPAQTASVKVSITINGTLAITTTSLPDGIVGTDYNFMVHASGGLPPYAFTTDGLPSGLAMTAAGKITGKPTAATQAPIAVIISVTDTSGSKFQTFTQLNITILDKLVIPAMTLPEGVTGNGYPLGTVAFGGPVVINATGGALPYTYTLNSGALPPGLSLVPGINVGTGQNTEIISGTPSSVGTYTFTIGATDSGIPQQTAKTTYTIKTVNGLFFLSTTAPPASVGVPYSTKLSATGGTTPYTFYIPQISINGEVQNPLPPGLTLYPDGTIKGTTTGPAGTYTAGIIVNDKSNPRLIATGVLTIVVQ